VESYNKLLVDVPTLAPGVTYVVESGSREGSKHLYFTVPESLSLKKSLEEYPGIDFKSVGYVVGAGSMHKSGNIYRELFGSISDLQPLCNELIIRLTKIKHTRSVVSGVAVDVSGDDLKSILDYIKCFDDYEDWIMVGMAIHNATEGDGIDIWDVWSQQGSKYDSKVISIKWDSFGDMENPVTLGSLIYLAEQNGYIAPVEFTPDTGLEDDIDISANKPDDLPFSTDNVDLLRPPGFAGKLVSWMNTQSYEQPLEHLTVITALTAIGNIIGMHTTDSFGISANLISLCVAESSAGKEGVQRSFAKIMQAANIAGAIAGDIKSKQEIVRNLIDNQAVYYLVDELGEILKTIENAKAKGSTPYLEGITGMLLAISTKTNGSFFVTGDVRREMVSMLMRELSRYEDEPKKIEAIEQKIKQIKTAGLKNPFLSLIGYSVSQSMDCIMTEDMAKNGFLSRALLVVEPRDNPRPILESRGATEIPLGIELTLKSLGATGAFTEHDDRIEFTGQKSVIPDTDNARAMLSKLRVWQHSYAEYHKATTGFTPLARRCFENICKISLILAAPEKIRTEEHIIWATKFVKSDIDRKIRHIEYVNSKTSKENDIVKNGIKGRILNVCSNPEGESISVILQRCKRKDVAKEHIIKLIENMVKCSELEKIEKPKLKNRTRIKYKSLI